MEIKRMSAPKPIELWKEVIMVIEEVIPRSDLYSMIVYSVLDSIKTDQEVKDIVEKYMDEDKSIDFLVEQLGMIGIALKLDADQKKRVNELRDELLLVCSA